MIEILSQTPKNPITLIGSRAGICYGSDVTDDKKNYKRGIECIRTNHGRTLEVPTVEIRISGYSARVIREWYTHIGCLPTRLQSSTRYIDYKNFEYYIPNTISNNKNALEIYENVIKEITSGIEKLSDIGIPKEDFANLLPMGYTTVIYDKRNLRNLIDMFHQRECTRAYKEYRALMAELKKQLSEYSDEWKWICENLFVPKCEYLGKCTEKKSCGRVDSERNDSP